MATEGKITAKNAWSLPLIDHMRDVVTGDGAEAEGARKGGPREAVNFQKASCTLEAGVKIYCSRVDDTLSSSHVSPRGYSVETSRGAAAAATWIYQRRRIAAAPRPRRG